jgi:hypothetical protein
MSSSTILESGFRTDLIEAHGNVMAGLAGPGTWWDGRQRLAIAAEVRRALAHAHLAPWDVPSAIDGLLNDADPLPPHAADAVWRITNHPGTLTVGWYRDIVAGFPSPEHYVELVGVVALVNSIDRFAAVLALDPIPLPAPRSGAPSQVRVDGAEVSTHWVPTAPMRGPYVLRALSAVPQDRPLQRELSEAQYLPEGALLGDMDWGRETIDRRQIELVAAQTSMVNECFY